MCLIECREIKLLIFINILVVLIIYFIFIDLNLFYLIFEIRLIPTFFKIIYWGRNPERLSAYIIMYILLISFPLLVYIFNIVYILNIYVYGITMKFRLIVRIVGSYNFTF